VRERCWLAAEATFPFSAARFGCAPRRKQCQPRSRCCCNFSPSGAWRQTLIPKLLRLTCQPSLLGKKKVAAWLESSNGNLLPVLIRKSSPVCINVLTSNTHYPTRQKMEIPSNFYQQFALLHVGEANFPEFVFLCLYQGVVPFFNFIPAPR
jgi:hypothetical protein